MDAEISTRKNILKRMKISKIIVDETQIKVGGKDYFWLWLVIEPKDKDDILHIHISSERNTCLLQNIFYIP
jgi:transposase-like protein